MLATRITEAYLKKVNDLTITVVNIWAAASAIREISSRFYAL